MTGLVTIKVYNSYVIIYVRVFSSDSVMQFSHRRRLFKMTAGARFQSPSEWPKATRSEVWGGGVPPSEVGSGEGAVPPPQKFFWLKLMHSGEILTLF